MKPWLILVGLAIAVGWLSYKSHAAPPLNGDITFDASGKPIGQQAQLCQYAIATGDLICGPVLDYIQALREFHNRDQVWQASPRERDFTTAPFLVLKEPSLTKPLALAGGRIGEAPRPFEQKFTMVTNNVFIQDGLDPGEGFWVSISHDDDSLHKAKAACDDHPNVVRLGDTAPVPFTVPDTNGKLVIFAPYDLSAKDWWPEPCTTILQLWTSTGAAKRYADIDKQKEARALAFAKAVAKAKR